MRLRTVVVLGMAWRLALVALLAWVCALAFVAAATRTAALWDPTACEGELLFNGICLPAVWPPKKLMLTREPPVPPYLQAPPATVNISVGRQLFVDDFLIDLNLSSPFVPPATCTATPVAGRGEATTPAQLQLVYCAAEYLPAGTVNPVVKPDQPWELGGNNVSKAFASAFSGGIWWDPADGLYKLWYRCGYYEAVRHCLAVSDDGLSWEKPDWGVVNGTNIVLDAKFDGSTVWLDLDPATPASDRFRMSAVEPPYTTYKLYSSSDGVHWVLRSNGTGGIADRSTIGFNPFRNKWVFSIKRNLFDRSLGGDQLGRARAYWEGTDLWTSADWPSRDAPVNWTGADIWDPAVGCGASTGGNGFTQLYTLDLVAYESVMVGLFTIFTGKECGPTSPFNRTGEWDSVFLGFSRDGFHWMRPKPDGKHHVFLPMDDTVAPPWVWNKANVQSVGGGFLVLDPPPSSPAAASPTGVDSTLRFYVGARSGEFQIDGNATTGVASLRRDGFASVAAFTSGARLVTRPVVFDGAYLFANYEVGNGTAAKADDGQGVRVEVLDADTAQPIAPFTSANSVELLGDSTRGAVTWAGAESLSAVAGRAVRFAFDFGGPAHLYSFWVSESKCGESGGFVAAGGSAFTSSRDDHGSCKPSSAATT